MSEKPLNEYIDMEAYDVVGGEVHRALQEQYEVQKARADDLEQRMDEEIVAHGKTEEQFETLERTAYPATPVDCLISELRDYLFFGGRSLSQENFEERVAQFKAEVSIPATSRCEKCKHGAHEPGACGVNVGTGYQGPVLCRCGVPDPASEWEPQDGCLAGEIPASRSETPNQETVPRRSDA